jgi:hypothetical protein
MQMRHIKTYTTSCRMAVTVYIYLWLMGCGVVSVCAKGSSKGGSVRVGGGGGSHSDECLHHALVLNCVVHHVHSGLSTSVYSDAFENVTLEHSYV